MVEWLHESKTKSRSKAPARTWIGAGVIERTVQVLTKLRDGEQHEGIVYWAGRRTETEGIITTCIAPRASTSYGSFDTSSRTNAQVVMYLAKLDLHLLGQVHSHPSDWVDHSLGDDERALMPYDGFLSLVVPHYGRRGMLPLTQCGVHVFEENTFRRLEDSEVSLSVRVVDDFADLR